MILCKNCGKQELYVQRKTISRLEFFNEDGELKESTDNVAKYDKPQCPKCGRYVKFFKDIDEVEE